LAIITQRLTQFHENKPQLVRGGVDHSRRVVLATIKRPRNLVQIIADAIEVSIRVSQQFTVYRRTAARTWASGFERTSPEESANRQAGFTGSGFKGGNLVIVEAHADDVLAFPLFAA
jgi:hypothetical protein